MSTYDRDPVDIAKDAIKFGEEQIESHIRERSAAQRDVENAQALIDISTRHTDRWRAALAQLQVEASR